MRTLFFIALIIGPISAIAQELVDDKYVDNNLQFLVVEENVKRTGLLDICIADADRRCVENLMTGYEVWAYNSQDKVIWKSVWSGQKMRMKFKQKIPDADYIVIKARAPFVVNKLTTTKIHQDKPLELRYTLK